MAPLRQTTKLWYVLDQLQHLTGLELGLGLGCGLKTWWNIHMVEHRHEPLKANYKVALVR